MATPTIGERDTFTQIVAFWRGTHSTPAGHEVLRRGYGRHTFRLGQPAPGGANFVFADATVHFLSQGLASDPAQRNATKAPANYPLRNLYFRDDGNSLTGVDF